MTDAELTRLYVAHMAIAGDFGVDQALCRWSIARHVRAHGRFGNHFVHMELES